MAADTPFSRARRDFTMDAARWVRPQQVADPAEVTPRRLVAMLLNHPPLRAMAWFRFGCLANELGIRGVTGWVQRRLLRLYGLELRPGADVGGGLYVAHPVGCVLEAEHIGENVTVISLVTFGTREDARWPRIDDGAFLGVGCRVLGGITLGAGARVGANAVVIHDVEPGQTVVGIPARPTRRAGD